MTPTFEAALQTIKDQISAVPLDLPSEGVPLEAARGRVLAEDARADRDYPPFNRSARDGFAARSADLASIPVTLACIGEVAAGVHFENTVGAGECVSIMTGAPVPDGADAVVMVEHTQREGCRVTFLQGAQPFENIVRRGSEAPSGKFVLRRGQRVGSAEIGLLASLGAAKVTVLRKLRVAILTTGDELVPVEVRPEWFQIRDSNAFSLQAQVAEAGGIPRAVGIAPDRSETIMQMIEECLEEDFFILSGGVSAGKYDLVERVLEEMGAEFYFRSVAIRPGKPLVFGKLRDRFFFGLPGNPVSGYVTFQVFVERALQALAGAGFGEPVFWSARLAKPAAPKAGLTTFTPARVEMEGSTPVVDRISWQGSGDLVGLAAANCFLVMRPDEGPRSAGDWVTVLPKGD